MTDNQTSAIRQSYDQIADEYARRIYHELEGKPFNRALLSRFAGEVSGLGEVCDLGCGPGHVARYLQSLGAKVFGLDISPAMVEQARRLNPGIRFQVGDMLGLDRPDGTLAAIVAFYAMQPSDLRTIAVFLARIEQSPAAPTRTPDSQSGEGRFTQPLECRRKSRGIPHANWLQRRPRSHKCQVAPTSESGEEAQRSASADCTA